MMATYSIREKVAGLPVERFTMAGDSPDRVATRSAVKLYGSGCYALRVTGVAGHTGWFRAYRSIGTGAHATSVGEPFHVF